MRNLKNTLEAHPLYLLAVLSVVLVTTIFLFIDVHDHFNWHLL